MFLILEVICSYRHIVANLENWNEMGTFHSFIYEIKEELINGENNQQINLEWN